jgi:hypothetical protein
MTRSDPWGAAPVATGTDGRSEVVATVGTLADGLVVEARWCDERAVDLTVCVRRPARFAGS